MIKTEAEIASMCRGGKILSEALRVAVEAVAPGVKLSTLNAMAEASMRSAGAEPSFLHYQTSKLDPPFPSTVCISVNDEVVHGCGDRDLPLQEGDIVGLDIGCWYEGLCTDMAVTVGVGAISSDARQLITVTKESLLRAVDVVRIGKTVADVGRQVEAVVNPYGYGIIRSLVGHGVGHAVHEDPRIPNYYDPRNDKISFVKNMCVAIEPMVSFGDYQITTKDDGWSIVTLDGSLGAHFEVTLAILESGPEILTPLPV